MAKKTFLQLVPTVLVKVTGPPVHSFSWRGERRLRRDLPGPHHGGITGSFANYSFQSLRIF